MKVTLITWFWSQIIFKMACGRDLGQLERWIIYKRTLGRYYDAMVLWGVTLKFLSLHMALFFEIVYPKNKNDVFIYPPSCYSKPVLILSFWTVFLNNVCNQTFAGSHWLPLLEKYTMEVDGYQQRNNNDNIFVLGFKSQFWNLFFLDKHLRKSGWLEKL